MGNLVDDDTVMGQNRFDCRRIAGFDGQYHVTWMMAGRQAGRQKRGC
jgi:hypothetical protein